MVFDRNEVAIRFAIDAVIRNDWGLHSAVRRGFELADEIETYISMTAAKRQPSVNRPDRVRITGPSNAVKVTIGKTYSVLEWDEYGHPAIMNDEGERWWLAISGESKEETWPSWEPCEAPSPAESFAPAASSAPAFDEAKEREAAIKAFGPTGELVSVIMQKDAYVDGWLDRARVAAKGGVKS